MPPPEMKGLRANERGQLYVPWDSDGLPNLHDYALVFEAEEGHGHSTFTVDPALTDVSGQGACTLTSGRTVVSLVTTGGERPFMCGLTDSLRVQDIVA